MKRTPEQWFNFCRELKGFILERNGKEIEKSTLFWSHREYKSKMILAGKTDITLKPRKK